MELNNKVTHSDHINHEDLERLVALDSDALSSADMDWVLNINDMISSCNICRRRYKLFVNLRTTVDSFSSEENPLIEKAIQYFQELLSRADQTLQTKISAWLDSSQEFLNNLGQISLKPATAIGTRDIEDSYDIAILDIAIGGDAGFFAFELEQETKLNFSIEKEMANGQPVCLAIFGRDETVFSALYPLTPFGKDHLRAKIPAALAAGKYVLCVPILPEE